MHGSASSAATIIARRRPTRSDHAPNIRPPTIAPALSNMVSTVTVPVPSCNCDFRNVGYMSCEPWLNMLNAIISSIM
jgi:hypothetical protein